MIFFFFFHISSSGCKGVDHVDEACRLMSCHLADHHYIHACQEIAVFVAVGSAHWI